MNRRDFLTLATAGAATATRPISAWAQQRPPLIGRLGSNTAASSVGQAAAYRRGLADGGFVEGTNVAIEWRYLNGQIDLALPTLAELIQRRVSVFSITGVIGVLGIDHPFFSALFGSGIPTVSGFPRDPRRDGFIASLGHPDRNLTGINQQTKELEPKRLNLLHDVAPNVRTVAYLARPASVTTPSMIAEAQTAAARLGLNLVIVNADTVADIDAAFARLRPAAVDALIVSADTFFNQQRDQVLGHAIELGLPAIGEWKEFAEGGALLSYGTSLDATQYQIGVYTASILKGTKIADLPVAQNETYEFVVNLKTAQALGLTVPPSMLAIATEVIE